MAVSTTTFDQRINRINSGKTLNAPEVCITAKSKRRKKRRGYMMPLLVIASLLGGGGAVSWSGAPVDYQWVLALAQ